MPLNRHNTKFFHRTSYQGITEKVSYLRRQNLSNSFLPNAEEWVAVAMPSHEELIQGEDSDLIIRRNWKLFRIPGNKYDVPKIGDRLIRNLDGSIWDIPFNTSVKRIGFGNYAYVIETILFKELGK